MPFKTRRQKEAASKRFQQSNAVSISYYHGDIQPQERKSNVSEVKKEEETIEKLDYVGRDIVKILLVASIICGSQIILALLRA